MGSIYSRTPASGRRRISLRNVLLPCVFLASMPATATETVTIEMESQLIDLDGGTVSDADLIDATGANGADVKLAYNADRTPHAVVLPIGAGVEMAFVAGVSYDGVSSADIATLTFSAEPSDVAFSVNDCVVVRTDLGSYFKLGNANESGLSITFNYEQL